jgi:hypothetical protein
MIKISRVLCLTAGLLAAGAWPCGCRHAENRSAADYYLPKTYNEKLPPSTGSLADINRKRGAAPREGGPATGSSMIVLLVAHDAAGKPVGIDLRQGSGDPALDRRAAQMVWNKWKFPRGQANTVVVRVNPKSVPRR